jgi:hypothetical protein
MDTFVQMMEAKSRRDSIREWIIEAIRTMGAVPDEMNALLVADALATEEFSAAVKRHTAAVEAENNAAG